MYNIQEELYIALSDKFSIVLERNTLSAALTLGNIYHYRTSGSSMNERVTQAIERAKKSLNTTHVLRFCEILRNIDNINWSDEDSKNSLLALRQNMLRDIDYFNQIDNTILISMGQNQSLTREVFIALIRKHLVRNKYPDAFVRNGFDYDLLSVGDVEQNYRYLYPFIMQCQSFCVDDIVSLGRHEPEIAKMILRDLSTSTYLFEVSSLLALYHPTLRTRIAEMWNHFIATHPLTKEEEIAFQSLVNQMTNICSEFSQIHLHTRPVAIQQRGEDHPEISWWYYVVSGAMLGPLVYIASVPTLICLGQGIQAPILPLLMTSAVGMGIGQFFARDQSSTTQQRSRSSP